MKEPQPQRKSEFLDAVRKGLLLGAAAVAVMLPSAALYRHAQASQAIARSAQSRDATNADFGARCP